MDIRLPRCAVPSFLLVAWATGSPSTFLLPHSICQRVLLVLPSNITRVSLASSPAVQSPRNQPLLSPRPDASLPGLTHPPMPSETSQSRQSNPEGKWILSLYCSKPSPQSPIWPHTSCCFEHTIRFSSALKEFPLQILMTPFPHFFRSWFRYLLTSEAFSNHQV